VIKVIASNAEGTRYTLLRYMTDIATGEQRFAFGMENLTQLDVSLFLKKAGVDLEEVTATMMSLRAGQVKDVELLTTDDILWMDQHSKLVRH
jgi:hypothetical protein